KLGPLGSREPDETFEVILFDPQFHISLTGDGDIVFQYLEVTDSRSVFERWDTPYATVGIGSPDQLDGIEYTYWGELVPGAAPLIDEAAIKFTTMVQFGSARVVGNVSDAATNEPIDNAVVRSSFGTWAMTNGQGNYVIEETLVANGYSFTASGEFFNDSTKNDIDISGDDINRVDFRLRHPEFNPSVESLEIDANYVETIAEYFDIVNTGNGLLTYRSQLNPREDDEDHGEPWDIMLDWNVGDITDDTKILGITYCDGYWLVSGGNSGRNGNWFYKFNRRGEYIERYAQPDTSRYGVRDLEYYENALYTVNSLNSLYKIDPDNGNLLRTWDIFDQPLYPVAITIDTQTNRVFIASTTRGLYQYKFEEDSSLTHTNTFTVVDPRGDHQVINPWGMSWFEDDPDDHPLYLYSINNYNNPEDQPDISLYKMNPETEHIISLTDLPDLPETHRGRAGCSITPLWDRNSWAIALVLDDAIDDRVAIFNLAPNYSWVDMNPQAGELYPGQVQEVELVVFTDILVTGDYTFDVHYEHNADPGFTNIPVSVSVQVGLEETEQALPAEYNLSQNYPNPFNPETKINYSLKSPGKVLLKVFDISGREVRTLVNGEKLKGSYQVQFDASELSTGIYFYSLKSGSYYSVKKMILVK
nr:T9SS type A sorting domain-containing protein [bacterium]